MEPSLAGGDGFPSRSSRADPYRSGPGGDGVRPRVLLRETPSGDLRDDARLARASFHRGRGPRSSSARCGAIGVACRPPSTFEFAFAHVRGTSAPGGVRTPPEAFLKALPPPLRLPRRPNFTPLPPRPH